MNIVDKIWEGHLASIKRFNIDLSKASDKDMFFVSALTLMAFIEAGIEHRGSVTLEEMGVITNAFQAYLAENGGLFPRETH